MMDPDKELSLLEQEFPKSRRAWIRDTSIDLDDRILSLAARRAPYLRAQYLRKKKQAKLKPSLADNNLFPPITRPLKERPLKPWASKEPFTSQLDSYKSMSSDSMEPRARRGNTVPPGAQLLLRSLKSAEKQIWLDTIADIVKNGDVELASYLLRRYRTKFRRV